MQQSTLTALIFLSVIAGCSTQKTDKTYSYNKEASLPDTLSFNPLEWKVITSSLNKNDKTMSTLYGNDIAVQNARTGAAYSAGSVLAMVTWSQQEDEHWFGGRIPGTVRSIEEVRFSSAGSDKMSPAYEKYEGQPLQKSEANDPEKAKNRIAYIVGQKASVMP
jgi:hypothetical protein